MFENEVRSVNKQPRKFAFTKRRLEQLKTPEKGTSAKQIEHSDTVCVGLKCIQSCLTGRKMFHQRYFTHGGKKKSYKIGEFPAVSIELAREIANGNKAILARGLDPVREREKQSDKLTFKEFAENIYLPAAKTRKKSWLDDRRKLENDMYKAPFGNKLLSDISKADIIRYLNSIQKRTGNSTANRHRALLHSLVNMAIEYDLLEKNNASVKKFPEPTADCGRCLSPVELRGLLAALRANSNGLQCVFIEMLLATGLRKSECLKMEWRNVNYTDKMIKLEGITRKNSRVHFVPISKVVLAILTELEKHRMAGNPYVFPSKAGKGKSHLTTVRKTFEKCKKEAGIENFRLHDCRYHFISSLAALGVDQFTIQQLVGHRSAAMTAHYTRLINFDALHKASERLSDQLGKAV